MSTKRIQHDQSHWQELVDNQERSGLSGAQFCREHQVAYASFMSWRKRLQTLSKDPSVTSQGTFVELTSALPPADISPIAEEPESRLCVELTLGAGIELRITRSA